MANHVPDYIKKALETRLQNQSFRKLKLVGDMVDFCSNDYLGLARSHELKQITAEILNDRQLNGSTGSRLLAGNYQLIEETEQMLAHFHQAEAALIFNSGYDANLGFFATVPRRGDTVIYDQLIHASIRDGLRMSPARAFAFRHNDLNDFEEKLQRATGCCFVVTESVFSMDGDQAPLSEIAELCHKYGAYLVVDEAHATGIIGEKGAGLVQDLDLPESCFARIHTFGKALGVHGAVILGSRLLRDYLINFCRTFIYTTALPPSSIAAIRAAYRLFPQMDNERTYLQDLINQFQRHINQLEIIPSETPIQAVVIPGNKMVKAQAQILQQARLDVRPILSPTVAEGRERLRIVLHAFNTPAEIEKLCLILNH